VDRNVFSNTLLRHRPRSSLNGDRRGLLVVMFVSRELQLVDLLVRFPGAAILCAKSAVSLAPSKLGRPVSQ
jgi:hypothetical protein